jgi:hypothetical protein
LHLHFLFLFIPTTFPSPIFKFVFLSVIIIVFASLLFECDCLRIIIFICLHLHIPNLYYILAGRNIFIFVVVCNLPYTNNFAACSGFINLRFDTLSHCGFPTTTKRLFKPVSCRTLVTVVNRKYFVYTKHKQFLTLATKKKRSQEDNVAIVIYEPCARRHFSRMSVLSEARETKERVLHLRECAEYVFSHRSL